MLSAGIALTAFVGLAQTSYAAQTPVDTGIVRVDYTSDADTTPAPPATTQQTTPQSSRSPMSVDLRSNPSRTPLVKTDDKYKKDLEFLKRAGRLTSRSSTKATRAETLHCGGLATSLAGSSHSSLARSRSLR